MRGGTPDARVGGGRRLGCSLEKEVLFPHTLFGCGLRGVCRGEVVERRELGFGLHVTCGVLGERSHLKRNLTLEPLEAGLLHNRMNGLRFLCQDWPRRGLEVLLHFSLSPFRRSTTTFSVTSLHHARSHILCSTLVRLAGALLEVPGRVVERVSCLLAPGLIPILLYWLLHFRDHHHHLLVLLLMLRFPQLRVNE